MRAESVAPCRCAVTERADLRLGRWQDVLSDVECDTLIVDAPYSERTHVGQRHGRRPSDRHACAQDTYVSARGLSYSSLSLADVREFVASWSPRVRGWFVSITDSGLAPTWKAALAAHGRTVFAALPCVQVGMNVRLAGDGPSNWTVWAIVARPKSLARWGTLRGAYVGNAFDAGQNTATATRRRSVVGSKPLWLMRALVRDYSRPGDIVCDPCVGSGTTLLAALTEGRRAVGAEMDPAHYECARKRLAKGYTPPLFADSSAAQQEQIEMPGMAHRGRDGDE